MPATVYIMLSLIVPAALLCAAVIANYRIGARPNGEKA
jgi:hypothetical protein